MSGTQPASHHTHSSLPLSCTFTRPHSPCWQLTHKAMWAAFWKNCVGPKHRHLQISHRCALLDRSVKPVLSFRNTRWAWSKSIANAQDRAQRRMLSHFVHIERLPLEDVALWNRRRMRAIATLARQQGTWGKEHAERVVSWASHLERERNGSSLAALFYKWHDAEWLQNRRRDSATGRPRTRLTSGHVVPRWDEAVDEARKMLE